ncbi:MAG: CoA-transferase [Candidatus Hermodarchaeota archaeon]|nr:CoA-transferase [Candidatus Hermodarchaeota archaeon]
MTPSTYPYADLILTTLAHQIQDGDRVFTGVASPTQMLATLLAKATHAPNLLYFTILGSVNPHPHNLPFSTGDPHLFDDCENTITFPEIFDLANNGRMDVAFLGGVQIDQFGSLNMSTIDNTSTGSSIRLPGGAGGPLMIRSFRRTISWRPQHSRRCLVDTVPFVTSPGWIPAAKGTRHGGPDVIVTDLCVFAFDRETKLIRLQSVHPGVDVEKVKEQTGFQFIIPHDVSQTLLPTSDEIDALTTQIDPRGIRHALLQPL